MFGRSLLFLGAVALLNNSCNGDNRRVDHETATLTTLDTNSPVQRAETVPKPTVPSGDLVINYDAACSSCRIVLDSVAHLGRVSDNVSPTNGTMDIARDSRGRFYTWSTNRLELLQYSASGELLRRIGKRGEGPGEISRPGTRLFITQDDSVFAFGGSRYVVFDSAGRSQRTGHLPGALFGTPVLFASGKLLMSSPFVSASTVGLGLHVVAPGGALLKSFAGDGTFDARCPQCVYYRIARSQDERVWVVPPDRYEMRLMNLEGDVLATLQVVGSWFVKSPDSLTPNASINQIREDAEGMLWVFSTPYDPAPYRSSRGVEGRLDSGSTSPGTVLDVYDPFKGILIASRKLTGTYMAFGNDYVATSRQTPDGDITIDIFRVSIVH